MPHTADIPFQLAWPELEVSGYYKSVPEDFVVIEQLPFELTDEGEHHWLCVEKRDSNTDWVAKRIAEYAGVPAKQVSYAGLKDRRALCRQWFSVHIPGKHDPDWSELATDEYRVLEHHRHRKKCQRGALKQNHFELRLRSVNAVEAVSERLELLKDSGVPNYFGTQRFGRDGDNVARAEKMFASPRSRLPRHKRSLYLSAARSWLFNHILSERIQHGTWDQRIEGEVFMLDGSRASFPDDDSAELEQRLIEGDIHPSASLFGEGDLLSKGACLTLEQSVIDRFPSLRDGLCAARMEPARRATRYYPVGLEWQLSGDEVVLSFELGPGQYATALLRELGCIEVPERAPDT